MSAPIPIKGVHHISLAVRDTETCRRFYCDLLGFREIERPGFDFKGAWLLGYGVQIHIIENPSLAAESAAPQSRGDHLAFALQTDEHLGDLLAAHGVEYTQRVNAGGIHQTFFTDPDGHTIELAVYPPHPAYLDES